VKYGKLISLDKFKAYLMKKLKETSVSNYMVYFNKLLTERGFSSYDEIAENIDTLIGEYNTAGKYEYENLKSRGTYHAVLEKFKEYNCINIEKKYVSLYFTFRTIDDTKRVQNLIKTESSLKGINIFFK